MIKVKDLWRPEFVYRPSKEKDQIGKLLTFESLSSEEQRHVLEHAKRDAQVKDRPNYRPILENSRTVMRLSGSFLGNEWKYVTQKIRERGFIPVPLVRDAHGGGMSASGAGCIHFSKVDLLSSFLEANDLKGEFSALPAEKKVNRLVKFMGEEQSFVKEPVVVCAAGPAAYPGLIFASQEFMDANDLPFGIKATGPVKGLIVPFPDGMDLRCDLFVPTGENKLKLSSKKLSRTIKVVRSNTPSARFSRNLLRDVIGEGDEETKGRLARFAWGLQSLVNYIPRPDLSEEKHFFETGEATIEFIDKLFGYTGPCGERIMRTEGELLIAGMSAWHPQIAHKVQEALWTVVQKKLMGFLPSSIYGVAMPMELLPTSERWRVKKGLITRSPWLFPIETEYAVFNHCIYVWSEFMQMFGGDFDGDQVLVLHQKCGVTTGYSWPNDKDYLEVIMRPPVKMDSSIVDVGTIDETVAQILDSYSKIGIQYTKVKVFLEAARKYVDRKKWLALDARTMATVVQPFIDGIKYKGGGEVLDSWELAKIYGMFIPKSELDQSKLVYSALRGKRSSLLEAVSIAQTAEDSSLYYEKVLALNFKNWAIPAELATLNKGGDE